MEPNKVSMRDLIIGLVGGGLIGWGASGTPATCSNTTPDKVVPNKPKKPDTPPRKPTPLAP